MEADKNLPEEEDRPLTPEEEQAKTLFQIQKESWYDKVTLSVKQLDIIIACGIGGLILTAIIIALDAMGVF